MTGLRGWRCLSAVIAISLILGVGAMAVPTSPALAAVPAGTWNIQTVDEGAVGDNSLALDSNGYPHISYTTGGLNSLHYARWTGTAWAKETVDDVPAMATSLALDSNNRPHISYTLGDSGFLQYAHWTGTAWAKEPVDGGRVLDCSLALDSNGYPHISYTTWGDIASVRYARWTGTEWAKEILDDVKWPYDTSIALDSSGYPHISYNNSVTYGGEDSFHYAHWTGTEWAKETVDDEEKGWFFTSIALDSYDYPHISYASWDSGLLYARWTGTVWAKETVDEGDVVFNSLALDSNNRPHISYATASFSSLHYARWTGTAWAKETVDEGDVGYCSLALDSSDYPHISYATAGNFSLHYARFIPSNTAATLPPGGARSSPTIPRPLNPPQMSLQYLSINPQQAGAGQPVTITTNVVNTGDEAGNINVTLKINGQVEQSRMVSVGPLGTQPVKFTVTKAQPGTYNVDILGKSGSFTILGAGGTSGATGSKTGGMIALALIGILIIVSLVVLLARRT